MRPPELPRSVANVRAEGALDLLPDRGEAERLAGELGEHVPVLPPGGQQDGGGRRGGVVGDPPCVRGVPSDREQFLLQQRSRLQRYLVQPNGVDPPFRSHERDALRFALGSFELARDLRERIDLEHAGGVTMRGSPGRSGGGHAGAERAAR